MILLSHYLCPASRNHECHSSLEMPRPPLSIHLLLLIPLLFATACARGLPRTPRQQSWTSQPGPGMRSGISVSVFSGPQRRPVGTIRPHTTSRGNRQPPPRDWGPTPWSQDWYRQEPWAKAQREGLLYHGAIRRYGGDLQGVIDQLDYLPAARRHRPLSQPDQRLPITPQIRRPELPAHRSQLRPRPGDDEALAAREDPTDPGHLEVERCR